MIDGIIIIMVADFTSRRLFEFLMAGGSTDSLRLSLISYASILLSLSLPILIFGLLGGIFGWTPGKYCLYLRLRRLQGNQRSIGRAIVREWVKYCGFAFFHIGALWAFYGVLTNAKAFYDQWFGLTVEDM
ncbi:MAG: RDD family protein, partial [Chitinivibrionales bacterium]|nr:RDD family protein [Chitinivibrionales bacterium]